MRQTQPRFRARLGLLAGWMALAAGSAGAAPSFSDTALANAVGRILMTDLLRERCPSAGQGQLAAGVADWERRNRAAEVRRAVEVARRDPQEDAQYLKARAGMEQALSAVKGQECEGLKQWIASPQSDIAWRATTTTTSPRPAPAPANRPQLPATPANIQGYALIQTYGLGYGGMMVVRFEPVVLFRSGDLLMDLKGLAAPGGVAAYRRSNPENWSRWRLAGGTYEYAKKDGSWGKISGNKVWSSPPTGRLAGAYVRTTGAGNLAMGGTSAVFAQTAYEFRPGGRVLRRGFSSASTSVEGGGSRTSTVTGANAGPKTGRYTVSGVMMTIAYDDGETERATLMTHPTDPDIIWLDGYEYIREKH
jgi:hypothetical protein